MGSKKTEERDSLFYSGLMPPALMMLAIVLAPFARSDSSMEYLSRQLQALGFPALGSFTLTLIVTGVAMAVGVAAIVLDKRAKRSLQGQRDSEIAGSGPRALFLRPFFTDKRIGVPNPFYSVPWTGMSLEAPYLLPEEFVGRVLEPHINVLQIGGAADSISNGKVYAENGEWQASFRRAVESANVIIIIPMIGLDSKTGRTLGETTLWELCYLVMSRHIARTIIIMPRVAWLRRRYARQSWERARAAAESFGLALPEFQKSGSVLVLEESENDWVIARDFVDVKGGRKALAVGLVEAIGELADRHGFELLDRPTATHLQNFL